MAQLQTIQIQNRSIKNKTYWSDVFSRIYSTKQTA